MRATRSDIPILARRWYAEKAKTCFGGVNVEWSIELCAIALTEALCDPLCYVSIQRTSQGVSACASRLGKTIIPPHPLVITEYMWWGDSKKATAKAWLECQAWGKSQGAQYAQYVLNQAQSNPLTWTETYKWRTL